MSSQTQPTKTTVRLAAGGIETMTDPNKVRLVGFSKVRTSYYPYSTAFWKSKELEYNLSIRSPNGETKTEGKGIKKQPIQNIQDSLKKLNLFLANVRNYRLSTSSESCSFDETLTGDLYEEYKEGASR